MKTINLTQVKIYVDITRTDYMTVDAKKEIANMLYMNGNGLPAHALALKIYNSDGTVELDDEELTMLSEVIQSNCRPAFIDGFLELLKEESNG